MNNLNFKTAVIHLSIIFFFGLIVQTQVSAQCLNTATVTNTADLTASNQPVTGGLRWAIERVNSCSGAGVIDFNIPGSGPHRISVNSQLPIITQPILIDGCSEPGSDCSNLDLMIEIRSTNLSTQFCLVLNGADNSEIRGLVINGVTNGFGIYLSASNNVTIKSNMIGTDISGQSPVLNLGGIAIQTGGNNTIGGANVGDRNLISGNGDFGGIYILSSNNTIQGNYIGTNINGLDTSNTMGNDFGILLAEATNNTIGGTGTGEANLIAFNNLGIASISQGTHGGNSFRGNSIHSNTLLGIDVGNFDGTITPNDVGDGDSGANNFQNFPVISSVLATSIDYSIDSTTTNSAYPIDIDFYANTSCHSSNNGEGEVHIGSATLNTPSSSTFNYTQIAGKLNISATATDANGNSSEFSPCVAPIVTAANVSISGRVLTFHNRGIGNASVQLIDQSGDIKTARTNHFGYYHFNDIQAGETYVLMAFSKSYSFASQVFTATEDLTNVNIVAEQRFTKTFKKK